MPDWSISKLYEESWEIVKKNKVLWIFGMALAGTGLNFNSSGNSSSSFKNLPDFLKSFPQNSPQVNHVLGAATSNSFLTTFEQIFSSIPWYLYAILVLELLFIVFSSITIAIVYRVWTHASLIQGIKTAAGNEKPTISDSSEKAFSSIKPLVFLEIVPGLVFMAISLVVFLVNFMALGNASVEIKFAGVIFLFISVILFIIGIITLSLIQIWAPREVILDKKPAVEALKVGFSLTKKKLGPMLLLGLVNTILSGVVIGTPVLFIGGLAAGMYVLGSSNNDLIFSLISTGIILIIVFVIGYSLLGGILNAFKTSVWTLAYQKISQKNE